MAGKGTSIKDAIKLFEEKKGVVAAEVEKVRHVEMNLSATSFGFAPAVLATLCKTRCLCKSQPDLPTG